MKKKLFAIILCAAMSASALTGCGAKDTVEKAADQATAAVEKAGDAVEKAGDAVEEAVSAADLSAVDVTVEFGDYEAMKNLSTEIQNGRATGQVVQVDGTVSNFAKGMSYSIGEKDEAAGQSIGTTFKIVGVEEDDYPTDGTHAKITGKVAPDPENGAAFYIYTLPEFVEVIE
ncbi:MAG: hypothetical protein IKD83_04865 [Firmicutes bacterium]|nr:hypothetical protein [Bacillota bacterium]